MSRRYSKGEMRQVARVQGVVSRDRYQCMQVKLFDDNVEDSNGRFSREKVV